MHPRNTGAVMLFSIAAASVSSASAMTASTSEPVQSIAPVLIAVSGLIVAAIGFLAWWRYRTVMRLNTRLQESLAEQGQVERELSRAKRQLEDAMESISEGFVLYDADERLVMCNAIYRDLHPVVADLMLPGCAH